MHITTVQISGDSQLVVKQLNREFKCNAPGLEMYFSIATYLLARFDDVTITHVPQINNTSANVMAQLASGLKVPEEVDGQWVKVSRCLPVINDRSSTGITPYALTYGHDPVLPMEITVRSFRVAMQNSLPVAEYNEAMAIELEDLDDHQLDALDRLHAQKLRVSKSYNRRVLPKTF
ncbi:hypothetical protein RJ640_022107 [Escallonia rubra]|uniref:RNase H type-1 domain-containing protein n=1 Tax=Escallonia rubra TaxID=112253 RepID=A0AA88U5X8_9ASTE|nr:hypothetical protein RJ640_022107 [Escallonia rubra]